MNELKSVYAKINSVSKEIELSSEKVEFNLTNEIISTEKKASKDYEDSIKLTIKILADLKKAISKAKDAVSLAQKTMPKINKIDKMAKDLGVTLDSKTKEATKNLYDISELGGKAHLESLIKASSNFN